jgi:hypothetical protein
VIQPESIIRKIDHEMVTIAMRNDGIVHVYFKPGTEITVPFQGELVPMYNEITEGKKAKFIFEGGEFVSITKDARENAIVIENDTPLMASAVIVQNLGQKIIADFYYLVNKPKQPYKVFYSFPKAIEWLIQLNLTNPS